MLKLNCAKIEDFEVIFEILEDNSKWLLSEGNNQWPNEWLQHQRPKIKESVSSGNYYYATINDKVSVVVELLYKPEEIWNFDNCKATYIHKLAVSREFSGREIGRSILTEIVKNELAKGTLSIRLDCVAANSRLRQYYEAFGFIYKGIKSNGEVDLALYEYQVQS